MTGGWAEFARAVARLEMDAALRGDGGPFQEAVDGWRRFLRWRAAR